ncbi:MAG: cation diffusion facilitator family transporter [Elusimicrobia bacterium]|nr:cation diffusion facilitator family transporter [Candidatus Liberimonas magnetica]
MQETNTPAVENSEKCVKCGHKAARIGLAANIFLAIFKGSIGVMANSKALIADAFHSTADIVNSLIIIVSLRLSKRPPDKKHPYGYAKIEFVASIIASLILLFGASLLFYAGMKCLSDGTHRSPKVIGAVASFVATLLNLLVASYTFCPAKRLNSLPLITSAWDNRSAAYSSLVVVAAVIGSAIGLPILDPLATIVISIIIAKAQVSIIFEATQGLMDTGLPLEELQKISLAVKDIREIDKVCSIKSRRIGQKFWVDMKILIGGKHNLEEAKKIIDRAETLVKENIRNLEKIHVYAEPA